MGLKGLLEKMKLVEFDDGEAEAAARALKPPPTGLSPAPPPRAPKSKAAAAHRPNLDEMVQSTPPAGRIDDKVLARAMPKTAGSDVPDFPAIYDAAGVKEPAHGFSALKVLEMMSSDAFAALEPRARAAALSGFLKMNPSGPVPIGDVVQDALLRDQALDGFEEFLNKKLADLRAKLEQDNQDLQAAIDELTTRNREKMDANRNTLQAEQERLATWQARKRIEERRLFDALAPFVEDNPVTLGARKKEPRAAPDGGTPDAKSGQGG